MAKVAVERGVLIALGATAGAALLASAFLLGRHSTPVATPGAVGGSPQATAPAVPAGSSPGTSAAPSVSAPVPTVALPSPAEMAAPVAPGERAAVVAYFKAVDRIQPGNMGNPEETAQGIMGALAKGDSSGMDGLIQKTARAREQLGALTPPAACGAYHRESLALLEEGATYLRELKQLLEAPGSPNAPDMTARTQALKTRTDAVQQLEQALRRKYGLSGSPRS